MVNPSNSESIDESEIGTIFEVDKVSVKTDGTGYSIYGTLDGSTAEIWDSDLSGVEFDPRDYDVREGDNLNEDWETYHPESGQWDVVIQDGAIRVVDQYLSHTELADVAHDQLQSTYQKSVNKLADEVVRVLEENDELHLGHVRDAIHAMESPAFEADIVDQVRDRTDKDDY